MDRNKRLKLLDELCSKYVRKRDGRCVLCGGHLGEVSKLQSHHWIVSRARSLKYRYDPRNCVSLCYACHIHKIHNNPTLALLDELKNRALICNIVNNDDIVEISRGSNIPYKMSLAEIEERIEWFKERLNE